MHLHGYKLLNKNILFNIKHIIILSLVLNFFNNLKVEQFFNFRINFKFKYILSHLLINLIKLNLLRVLLIIYFELLFNYMH